VFKGTNLKFITIDLEVKVWKKVAEACNKSLDLYPTSYQFDLDLLEADEKEK